MAREVLPRDLIVRIVSSFEAHLPDGVFLTLHDDDQLDVRSVTGGGRFGERLGGLPRPPMPAVTKWRLGIQSVYETVALGVGHCTGPVPLSTHRERDPFEIRWPESHCTVEVTVAHRAITARYSGADGRVVLQMPPIEWEGRQPEQRHSSPEAGGAERPPVYVGAVPSETREQDAAEDERQRASDAARAAVIEEVKRSDPGADKQKIRAAFRTAHANHPEVNCPKPGSHAENRLIDSYAAAQGYAAAPGPIAAAGLAVEIGKHIWDLARILRGTHPDVPDSDDEGG